MTGMFDSLWRKNWLLLIYYNKVVGHWIFMSRTSSQLTNEIFEEYRTQFRRIMRTVSFKKLGGISMNWNPFTAKQIIVFSLWQQTKQRLAGSAVTDANELLSMGKQKLSRPRLNTPAQKHSPLTDLQLDL